MKPVKVLHLFSGDLWAGAEVMIFNLLKQLHAHPSIRVIALSLNEGTLTDKLRTAGIQTCVVDENRHTFPQIFIQAWRFLKNQQIDVLHAHRYKENLLALLLGMRLCIPRRIATLHGLAESFTDGSRRKDTLTHRINHLVLRQFSRVVAVSEEMKRSLIQTHRLAPEKVAVIRNGIERPAPSMTQSEVEYVPAGTLHIGTVGRMVPVKDYDLFLEVAAEMGKRFKKVQFSLLGEGALKAHLQAQCNRLDLKGRVLFFCHRQTRSPIISRWIFT